MPDEVIQTPPDISAEAAPAPEGTVDASAPAVKRKGGKKKKFVTSGQAHIQATYNNTIVTITDLQGNVLAWSSAGKVGFSGPKKATPYAASVIVRDVMEKVKPIGVKQLDVFVKGVGMGREAAVRALVANGMNLNIIKDLTPTPHNGPRARKVRRV
jgi:small subunit ribosomal protein S11